MSREPQPTTNYLQLINTYVTGQNIRQNKCVWQTDQFVIIYEFKQRWVLKPFQNGAPERFRFHVRTRLPRRPRSPMFNWPNYILQIDLIKENFKWMQGIYWWFFAPRKYLSLKDTNAGNVWMYQHRQHLDVCMSSAKVPCNHTECPMKGSEQLSQHTKHFVNSPQMGDWIYQK